MAVKFQLTWIKRNSYSWGRTYFLFGIIHLERHLTVAGGRMLPGGYIIVKHCLCVSILFYKKKIRRCENAVSSYKLNTCINRLTSKYSISSLSALTVKIKESMRKHFVDATDEKTKHCLLICVYAFL